MSMERGCGVVLFYEYFVFPCSEFLGHLCRGVVEVVGEALQCGCGVGEFDVGGGVAKVDYYCDYVFSGCACECVDVGVGGVVSAPFVAWVAGVECAVGVFEGVE